MTGAIKDAAGSTGASFEYLLTTARLESNLNPAAKASTSSAKGLFQFIEQTWLGTVKEAGSYFGYDKFANAISRSPSGAYTVNDPQMRNEILKLRDDPEASAAMAGVLSQSNNIKLGQQIGRRPNDNELYMAHFMGVGGASKLIRAADTQPQALASDIFPSAAAANRPIFYDRAGNARTVAQVYGELASRYDRVAGAASTKTAVASTTPSQTPLPIAPMANPSYLTEFPDLRNVQVASRAEGDTGPMPRRSDEPMFQSLFKGGHRSEAVSPAVQELWARPATGTDAAPSTPRPLDLFSDRTGQFSS